MNPVTQKYLDLLETFAVRFSLVFVSTILSFWIGLGQTPRITGLWQALDTQWDTAAGVGLVAGLGSVGLGFLFAKSVKPAIQRLSRKV